LPLGLWSPRNTPGSTPSRTAPPGGASPRLGRHPARTSRQSESRWTGIAPRHGELFCALRPDWLRRPGCLTPPSADWSEASDPSRCRPRAAAPPIARRQRGPHELDERREARDGATGENHREMSALWGSLSSEEWTLRRLQPLRAAIRAPAGRVGPRASGPAEEGTVMARLCGCGEGQP